MERVENGATLVEESPSSSSEGSNGRNSAFELTNGDRTPSGNGSSTRGTVPRPNSKSKSTGAAAVGPVIPLYEKRASSLPVTPFLEQFSLGNPEPSSTDQVSSTAPATENGSVEMKNSSIARTASMPLNKLPLPPFRKTAGPSSGATVLLKSITSRITSGSTSGEDITATKDADPVPSTVQMDVEKKGEKDTKGGDHEEIPEEEAVCRICFEELMEDHGETLKMECSCRGEMALAHKDCALKWFTVKGNRTCDVCGIEVCNLPVTVVRQANQPAATSTRIAGPTLILETGTRVWQDVPVLVMLSMLVYFCFLEQLLFGKMGYGALAISLPFSCVLGLLAAITASNLVEKRYVWLYATCQLALVVCFAHIFLDVVHQQAVLSILLAAFVGFGVAMVTSTLIIEYSNYKRRTLVRFQSEGGHSPMLEGIPDGQRPEGEQQHDAVVLQMEGGGVASLWLRPGNNPRQAQDNQSRVQDWLLHITPSSNPNAPCGDESK